MNVSLIPETAPFSAEQRAWLNGFLAGWLGMQNGQPNGAANPSVAAVGDGTAAGAITDQSPAEEFPWHDPAIDMDERLRMAEGKPIERRLMAAMAQLDCGACGYLCKTYAEAIARGEESKLTLCSPGGKPTAKMLKKLLKEHSDGTTPPAVNGVSRNGASRNGASHNGASQNGHATNGASVYSRTNPLRAKVKNVSNLNDPGSAKHTTHVEIDLAGSELKYRVGDSLGVFPSNCPALVRQIIHALDVDPDQSVTLADDTHTTLRHALTHHCNMGSVEQELLERMIESATDPGDKEGLSRLLEDDDAIDELDVLDVLERFPSARPAAGDLVAAISLLQPRLYSIASSPRAHPDEVHLTVAKVTYKMNGRLRKGVASTMFADRVTPGETVPVFVHRASDFTVPADPAAPMIMVGPGTGVAPFRAFLEERRTTGATGSNWLFFGDQHARTDFLYQDELQQALDEGLLTRLDTAFSRDQQEKIYVQDRMLEHGAELFRWLKEGAYFFVCGDASRMARDVDRALHQIVAEHGNHDKPAARNYVAQLKQQKRYVRDVY